LKKWKPKHDMSKLKLYEVYCHECEMTYELESFLEGEIWCPLCESESPCRTMEIKDANKHRAPDGDVHTSK